MRIRTLVSGLLLTAALAATPAFADYDAAQRALEAQDYTTARKELAPLSEGFDPRVYLMLGTLNRDGKGGPADLKEAYRDFSLAFMYSDDPGQREQAFGERTLAARKMTPADIVASEATVAAAVSARLTPAGLKREIDSLHKELTACKQECEALAARAFRLGPAGKDLIPDFEKLMTRDPMWLPREWYSFALAGFGTEAVPALVRIMSDEEEMKTEGFWNLQQATRAIGALGPTAYAARPALLAALTRDYAGKGGEYGEFYSDLQGGSREDMTIGIKSSVALALVLVRDPRGEVQPDLNAYVSGKAPLADRLMAAWAFGALYRDVGPVMALTEESLRSSSPTAQKVALTILPDLRSVEKLSARISALHPAILKLGNAADEGVRTAARQALDLYIAPDLQAAGNLMSKGDMKAAIARVQTVLEMNPWSVDALEYRAEAKRGLGDINGAVADYQLAMERRGFAYDVQFSLQEAGAWKGEVTGDIDDATRKALEKCIRSDECFAKYKKF